MFRVHFGYVPGGFRGMPLVGWISGGFRVHFGWISGSFRGIREKFGHISGTFRAHFGDISGKICGHGTGMYGMVRDVRDDPSQHLVST